MGGVHSSQGVQTPVWVSFTEVQWCFAYSSGLQAGTIFIASHYRSSSAEPFSEEIQVQDAGDFSYCEPHQACHDRSKGH